MELLMEFIFNFLKLIQERKLVPSSVNSCIPLEQIVLDATVGERNPAPVDMVNIPLFTRFYTSQVVGLGISSINIHLLT